MCVCACVCDCESRLPVIRTDNHDYDFAAALHSVCADLKLRLAAGPVQRLAGIRVHLLLVPCGRVSRPICVVCFGNSFLQ